MRIGKKITLITAMIMAFSMLGGCWSNTEIRELALVMGAAIDAGEDDGYYNLTIQLAKTSPDESGSNGPSGTSYSNISASSRGMQMGLEALSMQTDRKLYLGHNQIIVVSKEVAENGIIDIIDFFVRNPDSRSTVMMYVAEKDAGEILAITGSHASLPSAYLTDIINAQLGFNEIATASIFGVVSDLLSDTDSAFLPLVAPVEDDAEDPRAQLIGTAVFKDDKMVTSLNAFETALLLTTKGRGEDKVFQLETEEGYVTVKVLQCTSKIDAVFDGNNLEKMVLSVDMGVKVVESSINLNFIDEVERQKINDMINEKLTNGYVDLISHTQEYGTDIFGFGNLLYRYHYHKTKDMVNDWDEVYKTLPIEVKVKGEVTSTGTIVSTLVPGAHH